MNEDRIKVWDIGVRLFHWSLVAGFALAWLTAEEHFVASHVLIGYFLCALLIFRLVWGFVGSPYARFSSFLFGPAETWRYVRSLKGGAPIRYYGHNPLGALMVYALLGLLVLIFLTGLITLGLVDYEGPFLFLANAVGDDTASFFRHAHDFLVDVALLLVPLHLLGVIQGSVQHRENLVRAMITGWKPLAPTDKNERFN